MVFLGKLSKSILRSSSKTKEYQQNISIYKPKGNLCMNYQDRVKVSSLFLPIGFQEIAENW